MKISCCRFFILVIILLFHFEVHAQYQEKIDSLLSILPTTLEDTNKVHIYRKLCWNYGGLRTEMATARTYADSMLWLSKKLQFEKGIIDSNLYYGMVNRYEGNYTKALEHLKIYVQYYKENDNPTKEARGWFQIGTVHQLLGNYDECLTAMEYILSIHEKDEDWHGVVATMNSIGIVYKRTEKYEEAIKSYAKAIMVNDTYNLGRDLTYISHNMGNAYTELKQYDQALASYQKSLSIAYSENNDYGIGANLTTIGIVYNLMGQHKQALTFHLQAVQIREKLPQKRSFSRSLIEMGNTYTQLKNYKLAEQHLLRGLDLAKEVKAKQVVNDAYKYLTTLYVATSDYRNAYDYGQRYYAIQDSIFSETKVKQINELQTKYETAEKDKQITLLAKEKEIQEKEVQRQATLKWAFIVGLILLCILMGLVVYISRQKLKSQKALASKNDEIKEANFKRQLSELEMKALQAQINPHFIFNCMNSINQMILAGDDQNASNYLTKLSKLIRMILENAQDPEVSLKDELATLEAYIQLEDLRFSKKIRYKINLKNEIDPENIYLPSMVLQPFVENAIWHGLMPKKEEENGLITISIEQGQDQLMCLIEDNGVGREKALELQQKSVWKTKSLGLKITEERLKLLGKELQKQLIRITDLKDAVGHALGTRVEVNIPNV